ncbi:MAG: metal ABC transporter permease [Betaproteobacteria bacterium]
MSAESLIVAAAMAVAAGLLGCFAVMRRMALASDALAHVALPGIGIALALGIHPLAGAVAMLVFGALLVWAMEDRTGVATEAIVGVVFSTALAVGSMLASGEDLIDALFGGAGALGWLEVVFGVGASVVVVAFVLRARHALVVALVSPDLARTSGVKLRRLNLVFLEMFALTVSLGLRYLGVLLMGSLLIVPAAAARRLSRTMTEMLVVAALVSVGATLGGTWLAARAGQETGPMIVSLAAAAFAATLLVRRRDR